MHHFKKSDHLSSVRYEIRGRVAQIAERLKGAGHKILELNIGNPALFGFTVPEAMNEAVQANIGKAAAYCHSKGLIAVREAIAAEYHQLGVPAAHPDNIFIGNGCSELIVMTMEGLINPGDEVLLPSPDYPLWTAAVRLRGGVPRYYECTSANGWQPDVAQMAALVSPRTKAIVVINPNNPTGAVYSRETLLAIVAIARQHNLILCADEIYNKITYDGIAHIPLASLSDDVLTLSYNGLSKNYIACGFRSGWMSITGPVRQATELLDAYMLLSSMRLCANVPAQWAIPAALTTYQYIGDLVGPSGRLLQQRDTTAERISRIDGLSIVKSQGSLYAFPEIDLGRFTFASDQDFIIRFLEEEKVLMVFGSGFNYTRSQAFRIVFLPDLATLHQAYDRLEAFLARHRR